MFNVREPTVKTGSLGYFQQPCGQEASGPNKLSETTEYLANHATVSHDIDLLHDMIPSPNDEDNDENIDEHASKVKSYLWSMFAERKKKSLNENKRFDWALQIFVRRINARTGFST